MNKRGPRDQAGRSLLESLRMKRYLMSDRRNGERGFSMLEMMVVVGLVGVISAIALPMFGNAMAYFRLSGDARSASNGIALGKMRAASVFSRVRLFVDLGGRSYHLETFEKSADPACCWVASGGTTYLSAGVSFGHGVVGTAPPNTTQPSIGQPPFCKTDTSADIANTGCIIFNSRGVPVDPSGNPGTVDTLYLTDATAVYGITVSATGMIRSWKTAPKVTPEWVLQ